MTVEDFKYFFEKHPIQPGHRMGPGITIANPAGFLESHFLALSHHGDGKQGANYLERLSLVKQQIEDSL